MMPEQQMAQGFTPYSGGTYGKPPGGFSGAGSGTSFGPSTGASLPTPAPTPRVRKAMSQPVLHLLPSLVAGVIGLALNGVLVFGDHVATDAAWGVIAIAAWAVAGLVGVTLLGWYFSEVNKRKGQGFYSIVGWKNIVARLTYVVLLVAVVWSAINIAQWVGKW